MALTFDFINSIIEIPAPQTSITIQQLIDEIRDEEDELSPAMSYRKIADAFGKQDLGEGVLVGITLVLLDNWKIRFEARPGPDTVACQITGGNLVAESGNPIAPSAYTQVTIAQSSSPTIAQAADDVNLKYLIASLSETQRSVGSFYYWDPVGGSDTNDGLTPQTAVQTFAQAQSLAAAGAFDAVYAISTDSSGVTQTSELIEITVPTLKLRGPGHTFQFKPATDSADTIIISADNVEVSGFYIETAASGTKNAVSVGANRGLIKDCWISNVRGHGINLSTSQATHITSSVIEHCGGAGSGDGISIGSDTVQTAISKCLVFDNTNGITLSGTGVADNVIENCLIYKHSGYGVEIDTGVLRTTLRRGNTFNKNDGGNTRDLGTDTYVETQAGGASPSEIADAVWDEVIAAHTAPGTAGRILKDTKTKATLASLK